MVGQRLKEILPKGGEEQIYGSLGLLLRKWKGSHVVHLYLKWVISGAGGEQDIGKSLSPYRGKYMFRGNYMFRRNSGRAPKELRKHPGRWAAWSRLEQVLWKAVYEWGCVCFSWLVPTYTEQWFSSLFLWIGVLLLLLLCFVCLFVFLLNGSLWLFSCEVLSDSL